MEHEQTLPEPLKAGEKGPDSDMAMATVPRRRRRGRTTLLIAAALVLGGLAGTATGYAIQYDREPTPLPPLARQSLDTPKALAPDEATTRKTINANRWHKTDGDLSKLLVEAPSDAKVLARPGYESFDLFATTFERPDSAIRYWATNGFRRAATTVWSQNDRVIIEIRLLQFDDFSSADEYQHEQSVYMPEKKYAGNDGAAIPGVPADLGHVWVDSKAEEEPGYEPFRSARAIVRRGDVVLDIHYGDNRGGKITEADVIDLAKRQLERL
ncbi:hypothetical protein MTF65_25780 [Streptomyces sp. APSN-46.1]|uniref:hypothetical protein n=1 Tax=Streptomyces sp. APSN-46.1 TaxID=2929049 RepID=UPI001FB47BFE|nr:hypothetical protein [Streptomyces sp. APSN-46.1]MCJ1680695.1 hypothetical protein [Streptomyces sp. APSN-46.1]